ncbi:hypothetical protein [Mucilaginibacter sp. HD30]
MNSHDFNSLDLPEKTEAMLKGTFLIDRLTEQHYIKLYNLNCFYVEVYFDDSTHLISDIHAFKSTAMLSPYLDWLSIAIYIND